MPILPQQEDQGRTMTVYLVFLTTQDSSEVLSVHSTEPAAEQRVAYLNAHSSYGLHQWEAWTVDAELPSHEPSVPQDDLKGLHPIRSEEYTGLPHECVCGLITPTLPGSHTWQCSRCKVTNTTSPRLNNYELNTPHIRRSTTSTSSTATRTPPGVGKCSQD